MSSGECEQRPLEAKRPLAATETIDNLGEGALGNLGHFIFTSSGDSTPEFDVGVSGPLPPQKPRSLTP